MRESIQGCNWPKNGRFQGLEMTSEQMFNRLCQEVKDANSKWWVDLETGQPKQRNVGELLMLVVSELAEALEGDRKSLPDDKLPQYPMFHVEIIDAMIRLLDIAGNMIPNPGEVYTAKMQFNAVREDHKLENRRAEGGKKY